MLPLLAGLGVPNVARDRMIRASQGSTSQSGCSGIRLDVPLLFTPDALEQQSKAGTLNSHGYFTMLIHGLSQSRDQGELPSRKRWSETLTRQASLHLPGQRGWEMLLRERSELRITIM